MPANAIIMDSDNRWYITTHPQYGGINLGNIIIL
jgi:hypothetical protein